LGKVEGRSVVVIGYQKGRDVRERQARNFGAPMPEGLRKAERLMRLAEKFGKPVFTLVDTPGAACLVEAEERGISEAIAQNQLTMSQLRVPIIVTVIGEGCSGGAIAIAAGDRVLMLEHAYYSVISPEGCASILWRDASKAADAADTLRLSARDAFGLGIIDEILPEPLGGAHREPTRMSETMRTVILRHLRDLDRFTPDELVEQRYKKYRKMGSFKELRKENPVPLK
jgi:acetyl-CoA carboxylase carboxyl transferase subunit alpha